MIVRVSGLISSTTTPSNIVIISTDAGYGTNLTPLLILTMKTTLFLDLGFCCRLNGSHNETFRQWRWQPHTCFHILGQCFCFVLFNAKDFLERSRKGKSINKHKGYFSMKFPDFNLTVEYYRTPFLSLLASPPPVSPPQVQKVIKLDKLHWFSHMWVGAQVLVFNSGDWWNPHKTTNSYDNP
ncbi:hypothetical protein K1719_020947 [Acacia pycnantha]|nr:hypothetical protein K1719_020947 [Acacia pycnantha]